MKTVNDWVPEVSSLVNHLLDAGFELVKSDNGEETFRYTEGNLEEFIDNLVACDESHLYVKCPTDRKTRWLALVLGNRPGELVSDYLMHPDLDHIADVHYATWENREQPTKQVEE